MKKLVTLFLACTLAGAALAGCGGAQEFAVTGRHEAASADGTVRVEDAGGGNNLVTIHLDNLPPPDRIATGLTTYVVWFVAANASPVKAATLVYDADARVGDAAATTPLTTFEVRVTAERANTVAAPSESVAITLRVAGES
jgi:hypothetical protein